MGIIMYSNRAGKPLSKLENTFLEENDILIFECNGEFKFNVIMFDQKNEASRFVET
jgi:hypothetical protein